MIRIAIIGAGAIAAEHIRSCQLFKEDCEITAVCDIFKDKAEELIEKYELKAAKAFADAAEIYEAHIADAALICLPPSAHAVEAIRALNSGVHVLVEKPMANSIEECDQMIEAAEKNNRLLGVVSQNRYKTPVQRVHQLIKSGKYGPVRHAIANSFYWRGESYYDIWWRGTWKSECGGVFTSHAVHYIDILLWMMGGMPEAVTAVISNVDHHNSELEDIGLAILEYPGAFVQLGAALTDHGEPQELVFNTYKGRMSIPWQPAASRPLANGFPEDNRELKEELDRDYHAIPELLYEGHPLQIRNFLDAILGKEELMVDGHQGRNTIELIMAIYKSHLSEGKVRLPIEKTDPFYTKEGLISKMPHFFEKTVSIDNYSTSEISLGRDMGK